jgi:hypothetical protein
VPAKRERILQLLRTVCDAEFERKAITASEVRAKFEYVDVPAFTYKHIRQFKGLELEEAMGL